MFERPHHREIAHVLQSLDAKLLSERHCYFGGGTAMALRFGEYRESVDIDFLVSDLKGYRALRESLGNGRGLAPITRQGMGIALAREVRADQYGIRTQVRTGESTIKFEIVLEARIELADPGDGDWIAGVRCLAPIDLAAEKLLANSDRWADDSVYSRDLIDLAMMRAGPSLLRAACAKAEGAYGASIRQAFASACDALQKRTGRLEECMIALGIDGVTRAQLAQSLRLLARRLGA